MTRSHWTTGAAVAALSLFALPAVAGAETNGTLFEPPSFSPGSIHGQGGWMKTGGFDAAIVANSGPTAAVFGAQSLRISNATTSGSFGDQTFSAPLVDGAGEATSVNGGQAGGERQPHFDATFQFMSAAPAAVQPGLAVTVSPDSGNGGRMSFLRLRDTPAGIAIDFNEVRTDNDFHEVEIAQGLDRSVPHTVRISMDFVAGNDNDVVKVYVDGQLKVTGKSWENYYRTAPEQGPANAVPVVDQLLLRVSSVAQPANVGKGFLIDDVSLRSYGGLGGAIGPVGPDGADGADGATGPAGPSVLSTSQPGANGAQGPAGKPGADAPSVKPVRVSILSSRLNRNTGVASLRLRCPARAGICSGNISLTNSRGVIVRKMYDLSANESATLRIRFASGKVQRSAVKVVVFSRDQAGRATRVKRTLR